jgi:hypothetical protein
VIPCSVQFIDRSAFCCANLLPCEIDCGNDRFAVLIDILDHTLIHIFSNSFNVTIAFPIQILGSFCFQSWGSLSSVSSESLAHSARALPECFLIPSGIEGRDSDQRLMTPCMNPQSPSNGASGDFCSQPRSRANPNLRMRSSGRFKAVILFRTSISTSSR